MWESNIVLITFVYITCTVASDLSTTTETGRAILVKTGGYYAYYPYESMSRSSDHLLCVPFSNPRRHHYQHQHARHHNQKTQTTETTTITTDYYQWVPFMLAIQSIMFYIPRLAWQSVSFNRLGTDLNQLVSKASEALVAKSDAKREECIQQVARSLELLLFAHRDYRHGVLADCRRSLSRFVGFLFASKRLGTWTVFAYFCIKLTYLGNTLIQLYIMKTFLNYDQNMFLFAWKLVGNLLSETYWTETLYFPRLAYCTLRVRHLGTRENVYAGVCALPVNMFNEKIYIFLFFWVTIVMICTTISLFVWIIRMCTQHRRRAIIQKYLRLKQLTGSGQIRLFDQGSDTTKSSRKSKSRDIRKSVDGFVNRFLRFDGVFLIHVMTANVGDVITAEVVALLWKAWTTRYAGRPEWEQPSDVSDNEFDYGLPTVDEGRTLTESTMSGQRTLTRNNQGIRRRPIDLPTAGPRHSLPQAPATWTCWENLNSFKSGIPFSIWLVTHEQLLLRNQNNDPMPSFLFFFPLL